MSDLSIRTLALCAQHGRPVRSFTHSSYNIDDKKYRTSSTGGAGAIFTINVVNGQYAAVQVGNASNYAIGDTFTIGGGVLNGIGGYNDLNITAASADLVNLTFTGFPFGYYNAIQFEIPPIKNMVYAEWKSTTNQSVLCRIDEFVNRGITHSGEPYWRMLTFIQNNTVDRKKINRLIPKTYNRLTVTLLNLDGTPCFMPSPNNWVLEIVVYSKTTKV